ncbi:MAG TPA: DUF4974 domain-containing protein [Puia sp.]|nr:DUF4974 domain-containing protein [Puia sp.]
MPEYYTIRRLAAASVILLISATSFGYLWLQRDHKPATASTPTVAHGQKGDNLHPRREHQLVFDNTPLRELIAVINDQYNVRVRLDEESTGDIKISGILPDNNLDALLKALEATMDFEIDRQGADITIRKHS